MKQRALPFSVGLVDLLFPGKAERRLSPGGQALLAIVTVGMEVWGGSEGIKILEPRAHFINEAFGEKLLWWGLRCTIGISYPRGRIPPHYLMLHRGHRVLDLGTRGRCLQDVQGKRGAFCSWGTQTHCSWHILPDASLFPFCPTHVNNKYIHEEYM